jgi:hypothetical protein
MSFNYEPIRLLPPNLNYLNILIEITIEYEYRFYYWYYRTRWKLLS